MRNLSQAQIRQVLTGQVRNWKTLGGPDAPIEVLTWRKPALIALFVEWMVLGGQSVTHQARQVDDASDMLASVAGNPLALGYVFAGFAVAGRGEGHCRSTARRSRAPRFCLATIRISRTCIWWATAPVNRKKPPSCALFAPRGASHHRPTQSGAGLPHATESEPHHGQ